MSAKFLFFLIIFLFPSLNSFAAPELDVQVNPKTLHADETLLYQITVQWPKSEGQYAFALPTLDLANLSVERIGESQESFVKSGTEWTRKIFSIELKPGREGAASVRQFNLPYISPDTTQRGEFKLEEVAIRVKSRGLKLWHWILVLGSSLAGFAVAYVVHMSKMKSRAVAAEPGAVRDPYAIENNHPENLAAVFQRFLQERFDTDSKGGDELLETLKQKGLQADELRQVQSILTRLEEARYMGRTLQEGDLKILSRDISQFIQSKRIVEAK